VYRCDKSCVVEGGQQRRRRRRRLRQDSVGLTDPLRFPDLRPHGVSARLVLIAEVPALLLLLGAVAHCWW